MERYISDSKPVYTREVAKDIVELFEDLLDKYDIDIPDEDREGYGSDDQARLFGTTWDTLVTDVECMIIELMERTGTDYKADKYNEGNWIN